MTSVVTHARWIRGERCEALDRRVGALRRLPVAMRGKARLARWILGDLPEVRSCEIRHRDGTWIEVPGFGDSIAFFLLVDGVYEPRELDWLRRIATGGTWVVDVGANVGALALPLAQARPDIAGILAVEASRPLAEMLERSRERAGAGRVAVVNVAAGAGDGEAWFDPVSTSAFGQGFVSAEQGRGRCAVPLRSLDSLLAERRVDRVSVLKIDVEGYEADVLRGAQKLLGGQEPPAILFEFYGVESGATKERILPQQMLFDLGYRIFELEGNARVSELAAPLRVGFRTLLALRRDDARLAMLVDRPGSGSTNPAGERVAPARAETQEGSP